MDREDLPMYVTAIGIAVTILSFLLYVFYPNAVMVGSICLFIITFAFGLILMVTGYVFIVMVGREVDRELKAAWSAVGDGKGKIVSLDGPYVPFEECGPIESLEDLRCQH